MQHKLIGGSPHVKVPCLKCKLEIWVPESMVLDCGLSVRPCSDCVSGMGSKSKSGGVSHKQTGADIRYHGGG